MMFTDAHNIQPKTVLYLGESLTVFFSVPSMALNLAVKVRYGGTYQPTISEAQAIRREARSGESV